MKCNIAGMAWKSKNKEIIRQYDFNYDRLNRLLGASFTQHDPDACTYSITPNFSVSGLSYDANGNILTMNQMGLIPGHSILIDSLHYQYQTQDGYNYTNKLRSVTDASFNSQNLSDFKDNESNGQNDYRYNLNGSLMRDNNKYIASIEYNHLNLPVRIEIANHPGVTNGVILYKYDALGNKQVKTVKETVNNIPCSATTYYLGEMVYEKREGYPGADGEVRLQFISNEEGRAIYDSANPAFHYQYMMRDHLGNIRMLLNAEEQPQQSYPNCDFEQEHATENETYYLNTNTYLITPPPAFNNGQGTGAQCQLIKNNEAPIGVGKLLKVMATDEVGVKLDYYIPTTTVDNTGANPVQNLIGSIIAILNNPSYTGSLHGSGITVGASFEHDVPLNNLLQQQGPTNPSNNVKAYLNILFFDACALWRKQFNFICQQSQYQQLSIMGSPQTITILGSSMIKAPANGYVYIYVSNESRNPVYIDNFQVVHRPGRIVEETHYYPFGLVMSGISSKAAGGLTNKRKWNAGSEFASGEFSDGSGLELYETFYRSLDPQIGRFWQVDPKPNLDMSAYSSMGNNPILLNDPLGDTTRVMIGEQYYYMQRNGNGGISYYDNNGKLYEGKLDNFSQSLLTAVNSIAGINDEEVQSRLTEVLGGSKMITMQDGPPNFDGKTGTLSWFDNKDGNEIMTNNGGNIEKPGPVSKQRRSSDLELVHEWLGHGFQYSKGMLNHDRMGSFTENGRLIGRAEKVEADAASIVTRAAEASGRPQMGQPVYVEQGRLSDGSPGQMLYHVIPRGYLLTNSESQKPVYYRRP